VRLAARGLASLSPADGLAALAKVLEEQPTQVAVMRLDLRRWRQSSPKATALPLLSDLASQPESAASAISDGGFLRTLRTTAESDRRLLLCTHIREQAAQVLRLSPSRIEDDTPLHTLGFDSLMVVELRNRLESSLGLTLSATLVWKYPTIAALGHHLASRLEIPLEAPPLPTAASEPDERLANLAARLKTLSDDDMTALLAAKLAALGDRPSGGSGQ
jgi:myxalamid-type polyketide synthase MxaE and MxaD